MIQRRPMEKLAIPMPIKRFFLIVPLCLFNITGGLANNAYSLSELEKIALARAPELETLKQNQIALEENAIAAGQLSDPQLQAGLINMPTDTFKTTQENMTQWKLSLSQAFPRGRSLSLKSEQQKIMARQVEERQNLTKSEILRDLRLDWLELYYLIHAEKILKKARGVFQHLVKVTTSILSVGSGNQHDVLRAQLDLSQVESRLIQVQNDLGMVRARLTRWLGDDIISQVNPHQLPKWQAPLSMKKIQASLLQHPTLLVAEKSVESAQKDIDLADAAYAPAWSANAHYSLRQGRAGMPKKRRADFVGVQLKTELPFFTGKRQDRKMAASRARYVASKSEKQKALLNLSRDLSATYTMWQELSKQYKLYQNRLHPEARQYAKSTLTAYENRQLDFPTVARAHDREIMVSLQKLRIQTNLYQSRANLLYLEMSK